MNQTIQPDKKYLLITTLEDDAPENEQLRRELSQYTGTCEIILTGSKKIKHCIGCNHCWIQTPGVCCIKDDYEEIFVQMLKADTVIFLTRTHLGFVCSGMKNLIDRILPMATMHLKFQNGQMRHYARYNRAPDMAMVYIGEGDNQYLTHWLGRVQLNMHGGSLGAFEFENRKGLYHALAHH